MRASFIIVNYNRREELLLTLKRTFDLIGSENQYEVIVVDNASSDGSTESVRDNFPAVKLIRNQTNLGAPAWNMGFHIAQGQYFIILDDDSQLDSGLDAALAYLDENQDVGVLALNITGGAFRTDHWNNLSQYSGFIGCGAIIRKEVYTKIGGYADWIFLYTNEYEYGIRCMEAGYKIVYFADCRVLHRTSDINRSPKRLITFSVRNEMAIVYKYFDKKRRRLFLMRVYLNNLRCVFQYGIGALPYYISGLSQFLKLKKELVHTPVKEDVQSFYCNDFWSTRRFLGIF